MRRSEGESLPVVPLPWANLSGACRNVSGFGCGIVFKTARFAPGLAIVLSVVFATDPDGWRFLDDRIALLLSDPRIEVIK